MIYNLINLSRRTWRNNMNHKIVFLDIDGTLTSFRGEFPDSARTALRKARENGHELVLCSGRTITQIYPALLKDGYFSGGVFGAGAYVRRLGRIIDHHVIDPKHLKIMADYLTPTGCSWFLQCESGIYGTAYSVENGTKLLGNGSLGARKRAELFGATYVREDLENVTDCNKAAFYLLPDTMEHARQVLGEYFHVEGSSFAIPSDRDKASPVINGEITIRAYSKSYGMEQYLKAAGAARADTVAFGDGPNDVEMLRYAATAVAMGNAVDEVKKEAAFVTDSVNENGLYNGFVKAGLIS